MLKSMNTNMLDLRRRIRFFLRFFAIFMISDAEFVIFDWVFVICTISDAEFVIFDGFFVIFTISNAEFVIFDGFFVIVTDWSTKINSNY